MSQSLVTVGCTDCKIADYSNYYLVSSCYDIHFDHSGCAAAQM